MAVVGGVGGGSTPVKVELSIDGMSPSSETFVKIDGVDVTRSVTAVTIKTEVGALNEVYIRAFSSVMASVQADKVRIEVVDQWCRTCGHWLALTSPIAEPYACTLLGIVTESSFGCNQWRAK